MVAETVFKHNPRQVQLDNLKPSYPRGFYWLIFINVTLDIFSFWSEPGGVTAILRVAFLYSAFFYFLLIRKIKFDKNLYIVLFSVYALLQLFIAVDLNYSLKVTLQIITSLLMFFVGYAFIKNEFDFYYYLKQFYFTYLIIIVNTIVSNVLDIGLDDYTKSTDYVVGGLNDLWNNFTYSLIMLPLLLFYRVSRKWLLYVSSFLVLVFLLISLKRIAILGVIFSAISFFLFYGRKVNLIKKSILFLMLIVIVFPLFSNLFFQRVQVRAEEGRFDSDFYESEGRYMEITYLVKKIFEFKDPLEIVFGLKAIDSRGVVGGGDRQFHVDYTLIAFTLGIFGLFLYLMIYARLIYVFFFQYRQLRKNKFVLRKYYTHLITAWVLIFASLVTSFGGQMYHVTFRVMIFMTLGAIYSLLYREISQRVKSNYAYFNRL